MSINSRCAYHLYEIRDHQLTREDFGSDRSWELYNDPSVDLIISKFTFSPALLNEKWISDGGTWVNYDFRRFVRFNCWNYPKASQSLENKKLAVLGYFSCENIKMKDIPLGILTLGYYFFYKASALKVSLITKEQAQEYYHGGKHYFAPETLTFLGFSTDSSQAVSKELVTQYVEANKADYQTAAKRIQDIWDGWREAKEREYERDHRPETPRGWGFDSY